MPAQLSSPDNGIQGIVRTLEKHVRPLPESVLLRAALILNVSQKLRPKIQAIIAGVLQVAANVLTIVRIRDVLGVVLSGPRTTNVIQRALLFNTTWRRAAQKSSAACECGT